MFFSYNNVVVMYTQTVCIALYSESNTEEWYMPFLLLFRCFLCLGKNLIRFFTIYVLKSK